MDSEWERHKETIRHLYLHQDKTLKQVMTVMKDVHSFQATAGQFERQIQKWCFRKNLTQEEWQFAVRRIKKRKREGKDTEVTIDGIPVTSKKLNKAIARYGEGSTLDILAHQQRERENQRSPTPYGLTFSTPGPSGPVLAPPDSAGLFVLALDRLPLLQFQRLVSQNSTAFNELLSNVVGNRLGADSIVRLDTRPWQQTQYSTLIMEAIRETVPIVAASTTPQDSFLGEFFTAVTNASNHTGSNRAFEDFLMNALGSMTKTRKRQKQTLKLLSEQNPTFEALVEVGFRRALECEHVDLVQFLVENSIVDPNKPIRIKLSGEFDISQAYFPVEYAISRRNFILAEVLIKFGARPDEPASILDRLASTAPEALRNALSRGLVDFSSTIGALCRHGHRHVAQRALELNIDRITRRADHTEACEASESFEFTLSLLWGAISVGDIRIAKLIIKLCRDLDLDLKEQPGNELVSLAVGAQSLEMLRLLLKNGAAVNTSEPQQISPLTLAILNSNVAVARLLIEWGAYVNRPSGPGLRAPSPLQVAAYTGSCEMASLLISRGADVNAHPPTLISCHSLRNNNSLKKRWINNVLKEMSGKTAILIAATCGGATSLEMVQLLGEHGADVNGCLIQMIDASKSQTSMNPRISTDAIFQSLLSFYPSFPASKALYFAIEQGFVQSVRFIFERKSGSSSRHSSSRLSIRSAIKSSWLCERPNLQFAVISYLIKQGAGIGHTKHGPLKFSGYLFKTNPDLAKLLVQNGASVDLFKELEDSLLRGGCEDMEGAIRQIRSTIPDHTMPRDPCLGHWSLTKLFRIGYDNMANRSSNGVFVPPLHAPYRQY